ncbi:MAG TPA: two-component regulator propeller domain-containing protein [Cyclobacteriaceae bacterium]
MRVKHSILILFLAVNFFEGQTQENIPLGTWRVHLSYNDVNNLEVANNRIFAASNSGIMIYDKVDQSITTLSKVDGLNSSVITALGYDQQRDMLLIGYQNGLISLLIDNQLSSVNNILVSSAISGSKRINHISISGEHAYLSTDFGIVVFDLDKREVKETYRDLSETGEVLKINQSTVLTDSIFLATEQGVIAGSLVGTSNLLDFRSWKRYDQGVLNDNVAVIGVFSNLVHAGINTNGIFRLANGNWELQNYLQNETFRYLSSSMSNLIITTTDKIWLYNGLALMEVAAGEIKNPDAAIEETSGIWVADGERGLVKINGSTITNYKPNGPSSNSGWRINYAQDVTAAIHGGFSSSAQPLNRKPYLDQFISGHWKELTTTTSSDITDIETRGDVLFISSFGSGIERVDGEGTTTYNDLNSPITKINPTDPYIPITSIEGSADGLWVANYGALMSLHLLSTDLSWQSFSLTQPQASFPTELLIDESQRVWMIIDPTKGGGVIVFDKAANSSVYLTTQAGKGGLPANAIRSIATDRDGKIWLGTDAGVVFYPIATNFFGASVDSARPIYENQFLLRDESVTAIAVDGGNRKWLGTNNGVWLFDPAGEELIYNFTEENSPLLSDKIIDISISPKNGEVFFATDNGLLSFRADATESSFQFSEVKIFPNPVTADFTGQVAINGLYTDAIVKITDINGRMVWQTRANGGTASWNARQLNGNRVSTGMYLVFATSEDGAERHVGKIAVIE